MQRKDSDNMDQRLIDKIINAAYNNTGIFTRLIVKWKISRNKELKKLFYKYRATSNAVHNLIQDDVPVQLIEHVKAQTKEMEKRGRLSSLLTDLHYLVLNKKAISASVFTSILLFAGLFLIFTKPSHKYSDEQIELAQKQFRQTLGIVGKTFEKAEKSFSDEILDKQINKKLDKGFYLVNNIITGG